MNFKQKFFYTVLGAGLMLIGMLASHLIAPLTAQHDTEPDDVTFGHITCQSLTIGEEGKIGSVYVYVSETGGAIQLLGEDNTWIMLNFDSHADNMGSISIAQPTTFRAASLTLDRNGGRTVVVGKTDDGIATAYMSTNENGGVVTVRNPAGMKIVTLEADDEGGGIFALVPANQADGGVFLNTDENGGKLSIFGKGDSPPIRMFLGKQGDGFIGLFSDKSEMPIASLSANDNGGVMSVIGKAMKGVAMMQIDNTGGLVAVEGNKGGAVTLGLDTKSSGYVKTRSANQQLTGSLPYSSR